MEVNAFVRGDWGIYCYVWVGRLCCLQMSICFPRCQPFLTSKYLIKVANSTHSNNDKATTLSIIVPTSQSKGGLDPPVQITGVVSDMY